MEEAEAVAMVAVEEGEAVGEAASVLMGLQIEVEEVDQVSFHAEDQAAAEVAEGLVVRHKCMGKSLFFELISS